MTRTIQLEFITPMFSHGATDAPEVRAPSIRGQLHEWFRVLGGDIVQERHIFGGIKQSRANFDAHDETLASKAVVRVSDVVGTVRRIDTLPHKMGGQASPRNAYSPGMTCTIYLCGRLGMSMEAWLALNRSVNAWLLMGTLGFRATRAGGSFVWRDESFPMPETPIEYQDACRDLLDGTSSRVAILDMDYDSAERARKIVSDSLGGHDDHLGSDDLARLHDPLGRIHRGRKTSPLKYRIVRFGDNSRILAFWDGRQEVTGNTDDDFYGVINLLAQRKPSLGEQLKRAFDS